MKQTPLYKSAVILHALSSLYGVVFAFPALMQGPSAQGIADGVPQVVIVLAALLGVAGLSRPMAPGMARSGVSG